MQQYRTPSGCALGAVGAVEPAWLATVVVVPDGVTVHPAEPFQLRLTLKIQF
jgi:hypothetical protein